MFAMFTFSAATTTVISRANPTLFQASTTTETVGEPDLSPIDFNQPFFLILINNINTVFAVNTDTARPCHKSDYLISGHRIATLSQTGQHIPGAKYPDGRG